MVWYGMVWYGMVRHGMLRYGMHTVGACIPWAHAYRGRMHTVGACILWAHAYCGRVGAVLRTWGISLRLPVPVPKQMGCWLRGAMTMSHREGPSARQRARSRAPSTPLSSSAWPPGRTLLARSAPASAARPDPSSRMLRILAKPGVGLRWSGVELGLGWGEVGLGRAGLGWVGWGGVGFGLGCCWCWWWGEGLGGVGWWQSPCLAAWSSWQVSTSLLSGGFESTLSMRESTWEDKSSNVWQLDVSPCSNGDGWSVSNARRCARKRSSSGGWSVHPSSSLLFLLSSQKWRAARSRRSVCASIFPGVRLRTVQARVSCTNPRQKASP